MHLNEFEIGIPLAKINDYLLNPQHRVGGSKAKFFRKYGFIDEEDIKLLLYFIIQQNAVKEIVQTQYGTKYIVEGPISTHSTIMLKTVWIVLKGEKICRFVTAYPL